MSVDVAAVNAIHELGSHNGVGQEQLHLNGMTNGVMENGGGGGGDQVKTSSSSSKHKSSSKDKHRDKDRDHHRSSSSKDHKSSSSSSRDKGKHSSSSSSSKDKDKEKDKNRDKDKDKHRESSKHSSSSSSHRDKERDKDKERSKDKHKSSSSSSHHKSSSKDKERSSGDKDKDRERKESSSSSSKDKDRHHKSSSRDKDRDKDRKRDKSSSSSSKSKHSSSSRSSHDKPKLQDGEFVKPEPISQPFQNGNNSYSFDPLSLGDLKPELPRNDYDESCTGFDSKYPKDNYESQPNVSIKNENDGSYQNISQASSCDYSMSQFREDEAPFVCKEEISLENSQLQEDEDGYDEEEIPLAQRKRSAPQQLSYAEEDDEEDIPLAKRKIQKVEIKEEEDDEEDVPLLARKKATQKKEKAKKNKRVKVEQEDEPKKKKTKKVDTSIKQETASPTKGKRPKKEQEEEEVWRWWEEEKREDGVKWTTLEHKGPVFAPPYERLPKNVRFYYNGKPMELSEETEEAATFYAKMLNHDYCQRDIFNDNFFKDFRKTMTSHEREIIKDFKKCNFMEIHQYFLAESEKRKSATKEEKEAKKAQNEALIKEYGYCLIDGHKEKIGNFRLEPPSLFRGRGDHPKMGMIKRRIQAEEVSINCSKNSKIPEPPKGHRWKEVRHDNTVTWLASWVEHVQGQVKYIMLNPSSKLKGEKDHIKYETARRLDKCINKIRATYRDEWKSKEMKVRQRAVALYFIDKLALRAGNEKDEDQADTVGCCSLRVEHIKLEKELNGKENVVVFDFLGKDSIRYYNEVEVEKRVFKNLELFMENKKEGDDLFDRLNTQILNEHLKELMDGLTAKVFRTYNASITLQNQLDLLTDDNMTLPEKILSYNRANRAVAILCNHQRSVPKSHEKSMENLKEKIRVKREQVEDTEAEYEDLKRQAKRGSVKEKVMADKKNKQLQRLKEQLKKLELQETDRDENKTIALGTSKLNYLDPRITVAWCKKHQVPIEKIYNKTMRTKFLWAIHMADENYRF